MRKLAANKGVMGTVVQAGVGGAAYFVGAKAGANIKMLQGRWWAMPTALLVTAPRAARPSAARRERSSR
jgi:hypothetical protein